MSVNSDPPTAADGSPHLILKRHSDKDTTAGWNRFLKLFFFIAGISGSYTLNKISNNKTINFFKSKSKNKHNIEPFLFVERLGPRTFW